jgi:competence protein ComEC
MLCLYAGALFVQRSDALTGLGLAALLLCVQNPFAALDVGLQLSFCATLGVLWAGAEDKRCQAKRRAHGLPEQPLVWRNVLQAMRMALAATVATMPSIISMNAGVSLLGVFCNVLCTIPANMAVLFGLFASLCMQVPWLVFLGRGFGLLCGLMLRWIDFVAQKAAAIPGTYVYATGSYAVWVAIALCALCAAAWYWRISWRRTLPLCVLFLALTSGIYALADADVVYFAMTGSGVNRPVVVTKGLRTMVIYRGPESNVSDVWNYLEQKNRTGVDLLVDLRPEGDTQALAQQLCAVESISVQALVNQALAQPFDDVTVYLKRQADGNIACVDVGGRRVGVTAGKVELGSYPAFDVYFGGSGTPDGLRCAQLVLPSGGRFAWAEAVEAPLYRGMNVPLVAVRAGGGIKIKEAANDFE